MKKKRKLLSLILAMFMMVSLPVSAYVPAQAATESTVSRLENQTKNLVMVKGQTATIKPPVKMTYSSSNTKVATVSSKGVIAAKAKGSAIVTGKYKSIKWTYKIKVEQPKLSKSSLTLTTGKSAQLSVSGTTRKQSWSSSNSKVATVSTTGRVTAKSAGTATVTVKINGLKYRCKITVKAPVTQTVWLSATGSKYHRIPNCGRMNPNRARQVDLSYAKSHGFGACSKCL